MSQISDISSILSRFEDIVYFIRDECGRLLDHVAYYKWRLHQARLSMTCKQCRNYLMTIYDALCAKTGKSLISSHTAHVKMSQ